MIIALTGYARSGKNTVAKMIAEEYRALELDAVEIAFADPLKNFCREVFGFDDEQLYGNDRERPDARWTRPDGSPLTARYALQTLGTEWGRNCDPDIWVKVGIAQAHRALTAGEIAVITDCRFLNEARAVRSEGGRVWRVRRGDCAYAHASEQEIWSPEMRPDVEIDNTGDLSALREQVLRGLFQWRR